MKTSNLGVQLIIRYEGIRLIPYLCPANYVTVNIGKVLLDENGNMLKGKEALEKVLKTYKPMTKEEAIEDFINTDLLKYEKQINSLNLNLTQYQFDALVSFIYNLGFGSLLKSTLLKKIKSNSSDKSIELEFKKWNKASGKVLPGLVLRRNSEAILFTTGELKLFN